MLKRIILFAIIVYPLLAVKVAAAEYFVAKNGNNSNLGTIQAPFKTINKGISVLNSGDTLNVRAGTYFERVIINKPKVTVQGYGNEKPIISGDSNPNNGDGYYEIPTNFNSDPTTVGARPTSWEALVEIKAGGGTFKNFVVEKSSGRGIQVIGTGDMTNVTINNIFVDKTMKTSLEIYGPYSDWSKSSVAGTLVVNSIFQKGSYENYFNNSGVTNWGGSVTFIGVDGVTFKNSIMRYSYADGFLVDANWQRSKGVLVENSKFHDSWGSLVYIMAASDITIRNSQFFTSQTHPVPLDPQNSIHRNWGCIWVQVQEIESYKRKGAYTMQNIDINNNIINGCANGIILTGQAPNSILSGAKIYNNTITNQTQTPINVGSESSFTTRNVAIYNNIFATNPSQQPHNITKSGISVKDNIWTANVGGIDGSNLINTNPKLVGSDGNGLFPFPPKKLHNSSDYDIYASWFKLKADSPAISKNAPNSPESDYFGCGRVDNAEAGAAEYNPNCSSSVPTPLITPSPISSPTPTPTFNPKFDLNDDGNVDIKDIIELIKFIFR